MNAREKAKVAVLRKVTDHLSAAEAARRGFVKAGSRTWVNTDELQQALDVLDAVVMTMVNGGDIFSCLKGIKRVTSNLGEYVKITRLESEHHAKAGVR